MSQIMVVSSRPSLGAAAVSVKAPPLFCFVVDLVGDCNTRTDSLSTPSPQFESHLGRGRNFHNNHRQWCVEHW